MSKSYYPTDRAGQIDWHNNFAKEFPKIGETPGFSAIEITNAVNDSKYAAYILQTLDPDIESDPGHAAHAVLEGQTSGDFVDLPGGSGGPAAVRPGIEDWIFLSHSGDRHHAVALRPTAGLQLHRPRGDRY